MKTYPALTALRFLAALLVFLFHFQPTGGGWPIVAGQGHVGVGIFFVLSGFLITVRYGERLGRGAVPLRDYFLRRAARILPLYYVVFILSELLTTGLPPSLSAHLSEWTLTQAFFGESLEDLVVQTSWSLTIEECFYALAPLLFIALAAAMRRRHPRLASAALLVGVTALLYGIGVAIWALLGGHGPGMLRSFEQLSMHTVFGRFYDFAIGMAAGLVFAPAGGRWQKTIGRGAVAAALSVAAVLVVFAAQYGMAVDGTWVAQWGWELLLAPGAALLILSLTTAANPFARVLGTAVPVYLGKISYALYLVQLTPLGKWLVFRGLLGQSGPVPVFAAYLGISAVSAVLYELVEEPARQGVLRVAGLERPSHRARAPILARVAVAALVALALSGQWAVATLTAPPSLEEVIAAGSAADRVAVPAVGSTGTAVPLPERWLEDGGRSRGGVGLLLVFADGVAVPFFRKEAEAPGGDAAFYRGRGASAVFVRTATAPAELIIARSTTGLSLGMAWMRLLNSPGHAALIFILFAGGLLAALVALDGPLLSPRTVAGGALACLALAAALPDDLAWGALAIVVQATVLIAFAYAARRTRSPAASPSPLK
jgi:peptidoglycan/LPS O-acetylase OafA/YrhL